MDPMKVVIRESRDSDNHPNSIPIVIALDTTGSMKDIPLHLVREGLPKMVSNIIQKGIPDPQILFIGVGDHEWDKAPLQVGQFESGDVELDLWLTRTWLEGGGGSNAGESYHLAWYFAANHTVIDSWEKRKQKGILFTIGDEPCLPDLPKRVVNELMGNTPQSEYSATELLELAQEKYEVYHLHILEGSAGRRSLNFWQNLLQQHCIVINNYENVANVIAETVINHVKGNTLYTDSKPSISTPVSTEEIIL